MTNAERHRLVADFRREVYATCDITLFPHQAEWQLAGEGWTLKHEPPKATGDRFVVCTVPYEHSLPREPILKKFYVGDDAKAILCAHVRRKVVPRLGTGVIAHRLVDLAAYKGGKSWGAGMWATGFACLPDAKVEFIGIEYSTSEPEFNYVLDTLLSEPPYGMGMKYRTRQNDTRGGRMRLVLETGAEFKVASWTRKESLKGKKRDAYIYTEAYQLPGMEVLTSVTQNLRERQGFAVFTTTPDRPWISELHDRGHSKAHPDWHCTCGVDAEANPFTYDQVARDADDPERGGAMTKERFAIAWGGLLGTYVGQVYQFQRGQMQFNPFTHPRLYDHHAA
jgi:hypothetical protein